MTSVMGVDTINGGLEHKAGKEGQAVKWADYTGQDSVGPEEPDAYDHPAPVAGNFSATREKADQLEKGSASSLNGVGSGLVSFLFYLMTPEEEPYLPPESRVLPLVSPPSARGVIKALFWVVMAVLVSMVLDGLH